MEILLVRHGKTRGNLERRYVGRTDEPLLPEEAERLGRSEYGSFHPDVVYTSSLLRCRQTAALLFPGVPDRSGRNNGWTEQGEKAYTDNSEGHIMCPGLNETDFGVFEYKNYAELNGDPAYQSWIDSGGQDAVPGGESGEQFRKRCREAFCSCVADAKARQAQRAAFVIHGGTIMAVMEAFGSPRREFYGWQVKNGEGFLTELRETADGILLELRRKTDSSGKAADG